MTDWPFLVEKAARGDAPALRDVVTWLAPDAFRTQRIIQASLSLAGQELARHLAEPDWGRLVPIHLLEFPTVLGTTPHVDKMVPEAFLSTGWAARHAHQLDPRALLDDMHAIAGTARDALRALARMRPLVIPPMHLLRVQALERITRAVPGLRDVGILEVGAEDGTLLRALRGRGARVLGLDISPSSPDILAGDLMTAALPGNFGIIVATAVFEHGSGWTLEDGPALLRRLRQLLRDDGVVVLENIGVPMPFTDDDVTRAGFTHLPEPIPSTNPHSGGRGCTLRAQ